MNYSPTKIEFVEDDWLKKAGIELFIKREDQNHLSVSGNKWWKLKYNLEEAHRLGVKKLLTFGGAYSNHIYATAAAAKTAGLESIGIIRGEKTFTLNPTLSFAQSQGMELHFISREAYKEKKEPGFIAALRKKLGDFYLIPEGGTNELALKGCKEWGEQLVNEFAFDYLCLPVGTGGTMAGLIEGIGGKVEIVGFSVFKDGLFLNDEVRNLMDRNKGKDISNWQIISGYGFGGYAKADRVLENFIQTFQHAYNVPLEHIYTGKMMYGICDLIRKGFFKKGSRVMALHTGGLQTTTKTF